MKEIILNILVLTSLFIAITSNGILLVKDVLAIECNRYHMLDPHPILVRLSIASWVDLLFVLFLVFVFLH